MRTSRRAWRYGVVAAALAVTTTGCGAQADGSDRSVTVFAAASLSGTFREIARDFEERHPGVDVRLSFGGSADLVAQIENGAPADVVATADEDTMADLRTADLLSSDPEPFASNTLQIAVPPGNPADVRTLRDLSRPGINLVVCAPQVPCGAAAVSVAEVAEVTLRPVSEEQSVTDVLGKVETGEADAGLVYVTDVRAAGDAVEGIPVPEAASAVNRYQIAVVAGTPQPGLAQQLVQLVLDAPAQRVLRRAGFATP